MSLTKNDVVTQDRHIIYSISSRTEWQLFLLLQAVNMRINCYQVFCQNALLFLFTPVMLHSINCQSKYTPKKLVTVQCQVVEIAVIQICYCEKLMSSKCLLLFLFLKSVVWFVDCHVLNPDRLLLMYVDYLPM